LAAPIRFLEPHDLATHDDLKKGNQHMNEAGNFHPSVLTAPTHQEWPNPSTRRAPKTYVGKINKAIDRYEDPLDRKLAERLTAPATIGVLRGLEANVRSLSREFQTTTERDIALRLLEEGFDSLADLKTVVCGIASARRPPESLHTCDSPRPLAT
jgi:hypothetical protein